ncbi:transposable element Tcb2 transposase [Trichonephila clavipes]|nr:transposable element Tcb2 transposase [Trichonephila clavipes]
MTGIYSYQPVKKQNRECYAAAKTDALGNRIEGCSAKQGYNNNPHSFVKGHNTEELVGWYGGISIGGHDNARPHRARLVENMLEAETIQRMECPACSPDLNPIEHVWDMFDDALLRDQGQSATVRDLEIALLEEWNSIPKSLIDNLIASMANRCAAVLAVRGDHTPY